MAGTSIPELFLGQWPAEGITCGMNKLGSLHARHKL